MTLLAPFRVINDGSTIGPGGGQVHPIVLRLYDSAGCRVCTFEPGIMRAEAEELARKINRGGADS